MTRWTSAGSSRGLIGSAVSVAKSSAESVGGQVALHSPCFHGLETWKGDGVVGVLLEQSGDESGGIETGFHPSKAADFPAALTPLLVEKGAHIPSGRRDFAGADEDAVFLGEGRRRGQGAKPNTVELNGDFQLVARLQSEAITDGFGHHNPAHAVEGDLHGREIAISQSDWQLAGAERISRALTSSTLR